MDWYEFKQLIDLTCNVFFAKNKSSHDSLWKQFEAAVLYLCEHYPHNIPSENQDDTSFTIAKKLYKNWIQFNYPKQPDKQFQISVGHSINRTFGTSFCLENYQRDKTINHPFFTEQKLKSNSPAEPDIELKLPEQSKENHPSFNKIYKGKASFFKTKEVNDLRGNIREKKLDLQANPYKHSG
jgi:hypothetical protein